jgi:hypothetical protein
MAIRWWATISIALGLAIPSGRAPAQTAIPRSQGTTLAGTAVALPDALKGKAGVLLLGFSHASQGQVASWGRLLAADFGQSGDVAFFELPMLAGAPKMLRGMIVKSMDKSVPEVEKPHFLPMMEDEPAWRAVARYDKPDDAYVLLVDGTGAVRWQTEGTATDAAYRGLKKNLAELVASRSTPQ